MLNRRIAAAIAITALALLSPLAPALAKETGEDRPVGTLGGAVHADPFTGVATTSIPIEVPPGRNGMQPNLALTYNSANGNGWLGMGWELSQEGIYRQTKWGVDYNNNTGEKAFVVKMAGVTGELVPTPGVPNQWSTKIEGGFSRIEQVGTGNSLYWIVTTKQGRRHYFGQTSDARQVDPSNAANIFGWLLNRVEDSDGTYMTFTYTPGADPTDSQVYVDRVNYAGNTTTGVVPTNTIKFWLDDGTRPDQADMYSTNYRIKNRSRLKTIEMRVNGTTVGAWRLAYSVSGSTSRSVLTSVELFGKDVAIDNSGSIMGGSSLPSLSLGYQDSANGLNAPAQWVQHGGNFQAGQEQYADINADGMVDLIFRGLDNTFWVSLSTGTTFANPVMWMQHGGAYQAGQAQYVDLNADGMADLVFQGLDNKFWVSLSTGTGFASPIMWMQHGGAYQAGQAQYADLNADGMADLIFQGLDNQFWVSISTGAGFTTPTVWLQYGGVFQAGKAHYADFNGDGKSDLLMYEGQNGQFYVAKSSGTSFVNLTSWLSVAGWVGTTLPISTADFNGDGKGDLVIYAYQSGQFYVATSTGLNFILASWLWVPGWAGEALPFSTGDFNGDGKSDALIHAYSSGQFYVAVSNGTSFSLTSWLLVPGWINTTFLVSSGDFSGDGKTDVMLRGSDNRFWALISGGLLSDIWVRISTGLGGATTVTYDTSSRNTTNRVPFALQRVKSISTCDNWNSTTSTCNTTPSTTTYSYSGGYYHIGERDLRGVAQVTVTGPADASGQRTITETYFHQGSRATPAGETFSELQADTKAYTKGQPYRVVVKDQTGTVQSETVTEYYDDVLDATAQASPFFTPVKEVVTKLYTGGAVSKETRVAYTYGENPQYGHVTREDHHGDISTVSDDKTVVRTYGNNTTDWLLGFPTSEIVYAGIGTTNRVAQSDFYYDGTTSCSTASTNQVPTKGHLTRRVRSFFNGTSPHGNPEIRYAYDSYGNRICTRDARGNTTTISYDSTGTFPILTTAPSPASLTTATAYYGVGGIPMDTGLYGQVKSVTDPNGRTTGHEYDALGRKTKTTNPDGFYATTTYNYGNGQTVGTQHVLTTNSLGQSNATYFDGLGRTTRKTSTYPGGPTRETKTEYDLRGQVLRTSLPYFTGGTVYWRTPSYDALGRVLQLTNPDTTVSRSCYADWTTVTVEADGDRKRETKDAYGRVVKIDEYNATVSTCDTAVGTPYATTNYVYDVLGNLTSVTDAKGNVSTMAYDSLNRKTSMHDPDMGDWSYLYDENGNLTKQTDAKGQVLWFQYDELNRRRQKDYTTQKALGSGDVKYTYDDTVTTTNRKGRLKQVQDVATDVTFEYDVLGRITKSTKILDGTTYVTTSAYDGLGRLTSVTYPSTPVKSVDYVYVGPYLEQVKDKPGDGTVTYVQYAGWNEMGQPATATYNVGANQVVTTYTYQTGDNATCLNKHTFRPCTTKTQKGTNPAYLDLRYVFTNGGNVQTLVDAINGNQDFSYDALDRLTMATGPYGAGGATTTLSYDYDEIGNLTFNTQVGVYAYPTSGASSVRPHAVTTAGANTYTYDANGNMLTGAGRTYTWNLENKPLTITQAGQTTTFVYDGDGGRVKKIVGTTTTRYISKLYECDNTNCTRYVYAGSARVATVASNGAIHFWHPDHLGSSTVITDSTGAKVQALTYYPYGATRTNQSFTTPAVDVPYKYTGKELDSSTNLYYYEARYYDPELGRFISADTIVPRPRDPQEFNRYSYAGNNPLIYTDPTGHWKCCKIKFKKFLHRALGDSGIAIVGVLGQTMFSWAGGYVWGSALLTQSQSGRMVLAGEAVAAAALVSWKCGGCGAGLVAPLAKGAAVAGAMGGIRAGLAGQDVLDATLKGMGNSVWRSGPASIFMAGASELLGPTDSFWDELVKESAVRAIGGAVRGVASGEDPFRAAAEGAASGAASVAFNTAADLSGLFLDVAGVPKYLTSSIAGFGLEKAMGQIPRPQDFFLSLAVDNSLDILGERGIVHPLRIQLHRADMRSENSELRRSENRYSGAD